MAEPGWPWHAVRIGLFEFRRSVRAIWRDKARFGFMALGLVIPSLILGGFTVIFADTIRGAGTVTLPSEFRGTVALFWLFGVFMLAQRVASARPRIDAESLMLTTVSSRTVAGGLLVAEILRALAFLGLPMLTLTGAVLFLFGPSGNLVVLPLVTVLFAMTAVVAAAVIGYAIVWLIATSRFVARHTTALGGVVVVLAMGGYALAFLPQSRFGVQEALGLMPIGWFADLVVVGTPITGSIQHAVGALIGSVVLLALGVITIDRETVAIWFTDPVSIDVSTVDERPVRQADKEGVDEPREDALAAAIRPLRFPAVGTRPTHRVAEWTVLRSLRDPRRLTFLLLPVVVFGSSFISTGVQSGSIRSLAAPVVAVVLPWMAGVVVTMNPLGDEGAVLPVVLTAVSGRKYVRGLMLPALVFGLPVVLVATVGAAVVSPYSFFQRIALVLVGVFLTIVTTTVALAIGMRFPRFSAISIGQSRDVLPPRLTAVGIHLVLSMIPGSVLVLLVVAPDLARTIGAVLVGYLPAGILGLIGGSIGVLTGASTWFTRVGQLIQATPIEEIRLVGGSILVVGGIVLSFASYRFSTHRFERFEPV